MLPPDYRWEPLWEGCALILHGVEPYPCRCAYWAPLPGGGGVLLHFGVRDCLPNQRTLASPEGATRFAEAWATKWDAEIRQIVGNKANQSFAVVSPSPEVARAAASRDYARRRRGRRDWWKS